MAGAALGALHGVDRIADAWREALEDGERGRSHVLELAHDLHELDPA